MNTPNWQREIENLHVFFEDWLGGNLPCAKMSFERLERALAPSFVIITPEGTVCARAPLIDSLYKGHGSRRGLRIRIKHPTLRFEKSDLTVATYEEWQEHAETTTARLSTVVFQKNTGGAYSDALRWLHVHETWLNV